jgi:hypothetical protein
MWEDSLAQGNVQNKNELQRKVGEAMKKFYILSSSDGEARIEGMYELNLDGEDRDFIEKLEGIESKIAEQKGKIGENKDRRQAGVLHIELCLLMERQQDMLTKEKSRLLKCVRDFKKEMKELEISERANILYSSFSSIVDGGEASDSFSSIVDGGEASDFNKNISRSRSSTPIQGVEERGDFTNSTLSTSDEESKDETKNLKNGQGSLDSSFSSHSSSRNTNIPINDYDPIQKPKTGVGSDFSTFNYPTGYSPTPHKVNEDKNNERLKQVQQPVKGAEGKGFSYNTRATVLDLIMEQSPLPSKDSSSGKKDPSTKKKPGNPNVRTIKTNGENLRTIKTNGENGRKEELMRDNSPIGSSEDCEDSGNDSYDLAMQHYRKITYSENMDDSVKSIDLNSSTGHKYEPELATSEIKKEVFAPPVSTSTLIENEKGFSKALQEKPNDLKDAAKKLANSLDSLATSTLQTQSATGSELLWKKSFHRNSGKVSVNYDTLPTRSFFFNQGGKISSKRGSQNLPDEIADSRYSAGQNPKLLNTNSDGRDNPFRKPSDALRENSSASSKYPPNRPGVKNDGYDSSLYRTANKKNPPLKTLTNFFDQRINNINNGIGKQVEKQYDIKNKKSILMADYTVSSSDAHNHNRTSKTIAVTGNGRVMKETGKGNKIESSKHFNK